MASPLDRFTFPLACLVAFLTPFLGLGFGVN